MSASRQTALLYERHRRRLLGLCRSRLDCRPDAEDALQQTFVYALRCLDRGVVPQNEIAWLNTIAENVCRAWTRNGARRTRRETEADVERLPELHSDAERVSDARDLAAALAVLPFAQRRALLLREWHGLSYREVAAELATTESAVETLIFRARRRAAAALTDARRALDIGTALAGLKRALGTLGPKGGAVAATAGCVTVAAAVPLARTIQTHRQHAPSTPHVVHVARVEPRPRTVLRVEPVALQRRPAERVPRAPIKAPIPAPTAPGSQPVASAAPVPPPPAPTAETPTPAAPSAPAAPTSSSPASAPRPPAPAASAPVPPAPAPPPAVPVDAAGAVDSAVNTVGAVVDTATTAAGSIADSVKPAIPMPPAVPVPVPAVPTVTTPALP